MSSGTSKTAVVFGATGINGANMVRHLLNVSNDLESWRVITVSRSKPQGYDWMDHSHCSHICADLLNEDETVRAFTEHEEKLRHTSYVFFAAYVPAETEQAQSDVNLKLLKTGLNAVYRVAGTSLEHVTLMSGGKYYGDHLGPYKSPAKEDDPRLDVPIHYYAQEDFLRDFCLSGNKRCTWSVLRPEEVIGYSNRAAMNLATTLAVYGSLCRELSLPMRFPGNYKAYTALNNHSDVNQITAMAYWCWKSRHYQGITNQAYNCVNGDVFRWQQLFPRIAAYFGVDYIAPEAPRGGRARGDEGAQAQRLVYSWSEQFGKEQNQQNKFHGSWETLVRKYSLKSFKLQDLATWDFAEFCLSRDYDVLDDMSKAREAGFLEYKSTEKSYFALFDFLQELKIIPPIPTTPQTQK